MDLRRTLKSHRSAADAAAATDHNHAGFLNLQPDLADDVMEARIAAD